MPGLVRADRSQAEDPQRHHGEDGRSGRDRELASCHDLVHEECKTGKGDQREMSRRRYGEDGVPEAAIECLYDAVEAPELDAVQGHGGPGAGGWGAPTR